MEYRKIFGLSHQDFMEEPYKVFVMNLEILEARNAYENIKSRSEERMSNIGK